MPGSKRDRGLSPHCIACRRLFFKLSKAHRGAAPQLLRALHNRSPVDSDRASWQTGHVRQKSDKEENRHMATLSLAELEQRHRMLEAELMEALQHPSVDDLQLAELKRRKLQLKDAIVKIRHQGSVH
jgi:hypothetical protein